MVYVARWLGVSVARVFRRFHGCNIVMMKRKNLHKRMSTMQIFMIFISFEMIFNFFAP